MNRSYQPRSGDEAYERAAHRPRPGAQRGDLEIVSENTMAEVSRGRDGREVLRVTFTKGKTPEGKDVAWHSIRVFWKDDTGQYRPGKSGVTVRGRELHAVAVALLRACHSSVPSDLHDAAKAIVAALERGRTP
jgi:hypothetical protein